MRGMVITNLPLHVTDEKLLLERKPVGNSLKMLMKTLAQSTSEGDMKVSKAMIARKTSYLPAMII